MLSAGDFVCWCFGQRLYTISFIRADAADVGILRGDFEEGFFSSCRDAKGSSTPQGRPGILNPVVSPHRRSFQVPHAQKSPSKGSIRIITFKNGDFDF